MKVLIAQTNTTPRDFTGNVAQIAEALVQGIKAGVHLVVTPELSIPGYSVKDLMYNNGFIEDNLRWLGHLASLTKGSDTHLVVGYIDRNTSGRGKPFKNMAAVLHNGVVVATYAKRLLPFYDVFDEGRYFEPGTSPTVVTINGVQFGLAICEDLWNSDKGEADQHYAINPLNDYHALGVNNIISINSSPYIMGKPRKRIDMLMRVFAKGAVIYVNQIGGQDDLVFDGHSAVVIDGNVIYAAKATQEPTYDIVELVQNGTGPRLIPVGYSRNMENDGYDPFQLHSMLVLGVRDYVRKSGFKTVVVGSSGGIDSAYVLAVACDAIGPENVYGIRMPSEYSSDHSQSDALQLHKNLGCNDFLVPIEHLSLIEKYNGVFNTKLADKPYNLVADENLQARIRGSLVMHFSNAFGALPLTTGNKSELSVGYCTLFGDTCGGFAVISDVFKMWVYKLSRYYNDKSKEGKGIPQNILDKEPSAELKPGQRDQDALPPYPILDTILSAYIEHRIGTFSEFNQKMRETLHRNPLFLEFLDIPPMTAWLDNPDSRAVYEKMIRLVDNSEFKRRQYAPGTKVRGVAFGTGRRLPIAKK